MLVGTTVFCVETLTSGQIVIVYRKDDEDDRDDRN
jgi:hypothetical protein